jgi:hypothetical protein
MVLSIGAVFGPPRPADADGVIDEEPEAGELI